MSLVALARAPCVNFISRHNINVVFFCMCVDIFSNWAGASSFCSFRIQIIENFNKLNVQTGLRVFILVFVLEGQTFNSRSHTRICPVSPAIESTSAFSYLSCKARRSVHFYILVFLLEGQTLNPLPQIRISHRRTDV